jgi:hypothetical protein
MACDGDGQKEAGMLLGVLTQEKMRGLSIVLRQSVQEVMRAFASRPVIEGEVGRSGAGVNAPQHVREKLVERSQGVGGKVGNQYSHEKRGSVTACGRQ